MDLSAFKGVMVLGEQKDGRVRPVTFELLNRGRALADRLGVELSCAVLGGEIADLEEIIYHGADRVFHVTGPGLADFLPCPYARALERLVREEKPEILIAAATTTGRTVMPLAAAALHTGLTADCTGLDIDERERILLQTRPAIGGNIMATIKTPFTRPQMATVRPRSARPAPRDPSRTGVLSVKNYGDAVASAVERFLEYVPDATQEVSIEDAEIIVAGGKGLKRRDGFKMIEELAGLLGAGVGASRDAVDLGWVSYPHQIGLSGKTVAPKLYIAVGISGKVQHLAGMQTSETIVAVNSDPEAQIFRVADFGIVGDAFAVLPELIDALKRRRAGAREA